MEGLTLLEYVQQHGPLSESEARVVMMQLLEAIKRCHDLGILHRDIKLDNIMFRTSNNQLNDVALIDFGLSRFVNPGGFANTHVGTDEYMAPEIVDDEAYTGKADIWSLGVVLYGLYEIRGIL